MERAYVKDLRHRHSYELRPDSALDAALRALAAMLEERGLLEPGASTAPRFHPHLTLCRAATFEAAALEAAAAALASSSGVDVELDSTCTFGDGRIVCACPSARTPLDAARAAAVARLQPEALDPLVHARPWTPHVTVAYAVPEPARAEALRLVEQALPLRGRWAQAQAWDLDVRPTRLLGALGCVPDPAGG